MYNDDEIIYEEFNNLNEGKKIKLLNNRHMGNLNQFKKKRGKNAKHNFDYLSKKYNKNINEKKPKKIMSNRRNHLVKENSTLLHESIPEYLTDMNSDMFIDDIMLSETYFGGNNQLSDCETYLDDMKKYLISGKNPNKCPSKIKFENTLAQLFGFEKIYLILIADEITCNAFTIPYFYQTDKDYNDKFFDLEKSNKYGIKFKNPKGKFLYIYSYNYLLRNVPSKNIMAIFLHEIGHNFFLLKNQVNYSKTKLGVDTCLKVLEYLKNNNFNAIASAIATQTLLENFIQLEDVQGYYKKEFKDVTSDKAQKNALKLAEVLNNPIFKNFLKIITVAEKLFVTLFKLPVTPIYLVLAPFIMNATIISSENEKEFKKVNIFTDGYSNEKFADNFAASYGYGSDLAEFFNDYKTIENSERKKIEQSIPIYRVMKLYDKLLLQFTEYFSDPHPDNYYRIKFVLDKLKFELKNNQDQLNPKQISEIENNINRLEKLLKDAPKYYKVINEVFDNVRNKRENLSLKYSQLSNENIYNFDKEVINDKIVKENYNELIDKYFDDNYYFINHLDENN